MGKKSILITGGNGFIAKNLIEQLGDEYNMASPNSKELNLLDSKYAFSFLKDNKYDIVIHTATYDAAPKHSIKDPAKVLENNLRMFFNLARCEKHFGKMIYFGSGAEYGREHWIPKMDENYFDKYVPTDQYGFSKYLMAKYTLESKNIYNLRLFGVFGKYDDWRTRFIPNVICQAIMGLQIKIKNNNNYDFLYISDLVKVLRWVIEGNPKHRIYNVCSGNIYNFKELAKIIVKLSGKDLDIHLDSKNISSEYSGDNSLLLKENKRMKFTSINEAISELFHWYKQNFSKINKEALNG